jgi:hypothetical protein
MKNRLHKFFFIFFTISLFSCSIDYKEANKKAVESFRAQIIAGKFEEHYNSNVKAYISKEEFVENMKLAVSTMKEFDENLNWQQDEAAED